MHCSFIEKINLFGTIAPSKVVLDIKGPPNDVKYNLYLIGPINDWLVICEGYNDLEQCVANFLKLTAFDLGGEDFIKNVSDFINVKKAVNTAVLGWLGTEKVMLDRLEMTRTTSDVPPSQLGSHVNCRCSTLETVAPDVVLPPVEIHPVHIKGTLTADEPPTPATACNKVQGYYLADETDEEAKEPKLDKKCPLCGAPAYKDDQGVVMCPEDREARAKTLKSLA